MATLIQEIAGSASAWHGGDDDTFSMTFDLDFPPHGAFIKVALSQFFQWSAGAGATDYGAASTGLVNMRRRLPDNSDATITFPSIQTGDAVYVMYDPTMTHVTFGIAVQHCIATLVWTHEVFV
jgi:hypothetical protein